MKPDDNSRYFPSRRPPRSRSSREARPLDSSDDVNSQPSRKSADANVDDAWNKIASELERIDSFGSEYDDFENWGARSPKDVDNSSKSSRTVDNAPTVNESARDSLRRASNVLSNDSQASYNEDKLSEDYETRNKRRANSVWDSGGWRSYSNEGTTSKRSSSYSHTPRRSSTNHDSYRPSDASENPGGYKRQSGNFTNFSRNSNSTSRYDGRRGVAENTRFQSEKASSRRFGSEHDSNYRGGDSRRNYTNAPERTRRFNDERFENTDSNRVRRRPGSFSSEYDNFGRNRNSQRRSESKPSSGAFGRYDEPLSLAEAYAERYDRRNGSKDANDFNETYKKFPLNQIEDSSFESNSCDVDALKDMSIYELIDEARRLDGDPRGAFVKRVLHERVVQAGLMIAAGTLEILPDGFGFLRSVETNYLSCADDIYVSPSQIRRFNLRNGLVVSGLIRPPKERERYFALLRIDSINGQAPNSLASTPCFDDLVAARPTRRLKFEQVAENVENSNTSAFDTSTLTPTFNEVAQASKGADMRLLDLVLPLGFGQRALVVCPPRSGKTPLIRKMVESTLANYDEAFVFVVLIKKRPEDVTEARRVLTNERCEIVGTTFDELDARHIQIALMVFEKAKRMVEYGENVVVFVDSLTRLFSAWRGEEPNEQNMTAALQFVRKLFGSSRKIDGGGSLTVVATSLWNEDVPETQAELEALQSISHATLWLDSDLTSRNVWPPINVVKSATRDYKDFVAEEEQILLEKVRETTQGKEPTNAIRELLDKIAGTSNNRELLRVLDGNSSKKNNDVV